MFALNSQSIWREKEEEEEENKLAYAQSVSWFAEINERGEKEKEKLVQKKEDLGLASTNAVNR